MGCKNRSSHLSLLETLTTFVSTPSLDTSGTITTTSKYSLAFRGTRERRTSEPKLSLPQQKEKEKTIAKLCSHSHRCSVSVRLVSRSAGMLRKPARHRFPLSGLPAKCASQSCISCCSTAVSLFFILRTRLILLPRPTPVLETPVYDRRRHSAKNLRLSKATASIVPFCEWSSSGSSLGFSVAGFRGFLALVFTHDSALWTTTRSCRAVRVSSGQCSLIFLCNAFSIVCFLCFLYTGLSGSVRLFASFFTGKRRRFCFFCLVPRILAAFRASSCEIFAQLLECQLVVYIYEEQS